MEKSLEAIVRELADREAIRELTHRYCQCMWTADHEGYADLFTEDGAFDATPRVPVVTGRDNLRRYIQGPMATKKSRPFVHNLVINLLDANNATGWCCVEVRVGARNMEWQESSYYHDVFQKVGGEWKFKSRKLLPAVAE